MKQICKNICVPPHDKSFKSPKYTATLSKPVRTLQRYSSTSSESLYKQKASSCSLETEKGDKQPSKQPVNSLIRFYDKSLKDKISIRKESNNNFQRTKNKNKNIHQMNTNNSKQGTAIDGRNKNLEIPSQSNLESKLKEDAPIVTNSIDEFLKSVKRTKLKYQEMLNNKDEKGSDTHGAVIPL